MHHYAIESTFENIKIYLQIVRYYLRYETLATRDTYQITH